MIAHFYVLLSLQVWQKKITLLCKRKKTVLLDGNCSLWLFQITRANRINAGEGKYKIENKRETKCWMVSRWVELSATDWGERHDSSGAQMVHVCHWTALYVETRHSFPCLVTFSILFFLLSQCHVITSCRWKKDYQYYLVASCELEWKWEFSVDRPHDIL